MSAFWLPLFVVLGAASLSPHWVRLSIFGQPDEMEALLVSDPRALAQVDANGRTPLALASAFNPNPTVIRILLNAGASLLDRDIHGRTPLMLAAEFNRAEVVEALLVAGADPSSKDVKGHTASDLAAQNPFLSGTPTYWKLYREQYGDWP